VAEQQTMGRGKPGSCWFSPPGVGLYFSVILKPYKNPDKLAAFTLLCANAVISTIQKLYNLRASVKLPNDVLLGTKKVCGIITEKTAAGLIVGVGVNVNTKEFPPDLAESATSIFLELGHSVDKETLFQEILSCLNHEYLKFLGNKV